MSEFHKLEDEFYQKWIHDRGNRPEGWRNWMFSSIFRCNIQKLMEECPALYENVDGEKVYAEKRPAYDQVRVWSTTSKEATIEWAKQFAVKLEINQENSGNG